MNRAKPEEKITEVVDDMVDAVAGAEPLVSYFKKKKLIKRLVITFSLKGAIRSSYGCAIPFSCVEFYATGNARPRSQSVKY